MPGGHRPGEFSIGPDSSRPFASSVQQIAAQRRASLGQLEPRILSVGGDLLQSASSQGQKSCLRLAGLGPALVENRLENEANTRSIRRGLACPQSAQTRLLGVATCQQDPRFGQGLTL